MHEETVEKFRFAVDVRCRLKRELAKEVRVELRDHDRRITRLEAQWQTALDLRGGTRRLENN